MSHRIREMTIGDKDDNIIQLFKKRLALQFGMLIHDEFLMYSLNASAAENI